MEYACWFRDVLIFTAGPLVIIAGLVPVIWGASIRRMFDPHLLNEKYWQNSQGEQTFFFAQLRAAVYLAAFGSRRLQRRRFPGANMSTMAPSSLRPFAALYCFAMLAGVSLGMVLAVLTLICGRP